MWTNIKIGMAAALILGNASAAVASDQSGDYSGGAPTQTWQDIELSRQKIQLLIQEQYPSTNPGKTYDYVAPRKPRGSRE
jgi:hypothetical protein